ncbi:hypothetical protein IP78_14570 [Brevundimonas sp. AAP58]|nr:hypothetical protein IP78_14570 [Brevundimonas sp. AAP58]
MHAQSAVQQAPATVDDVVVEGVRLRERAETFVDRAAAPARGRGLGRWQGRVCAAVVNLRAEIARPIVERVSDMAAGLGLRIGGDGCDANVVIVFAADATAMVGTLAEERRRAFRPGTSGLERGERAFQAFLNGDRPVRWWHLSMPVDAETGARATRLPGDIRSGGAPSAPYVSTIASRLNTQVRDDIFKALIFVDIDQLHDVTAAQLADYLALVALAQIDPEAELVGYDSILNLFVERSGAPDGLTDWDRSFLEALYTTLDEPQGPQNAAAQADAVAGALARRREADRTTSTPD